MDDLNAQFREAMSMCDAAARPLLDARILHEGRFDEAQALLRAMNESAQRMASLARKIHVANGGH